MPNIISRVKGLLTYGNVSLSLNLNGQTPLVQKAITDAQFFFNLEDWEKQYYTPAGCPQFPENPGYLLTGVMPKYEEYFYFNDLLKKSLDNQQLDYSELHNFLSDAEALKVLCFNQLEAICVELDTDHAIEGFSFKEMLKSREEAACLRFSGYTLNKYLYQIADPLWQKNFFMSLQLLKKDEEIWGLVFFGNNIEEMSGGKVKAFLNSFVLSGGQDLLSVRYIV